MRSSSRSDAVSQTAHRRPHINNMIQLYPWRVKGQIPGNCISLSVGRGPNLWPVEWFIGCHWLVGELGYLLLYHQECCYSEAPNVMMGTSSPLTHSHISTSKLAKENVRWSGGFHSRFSSSGGVGEVHFICPKDGNRFIYSSWKVACCISKLNKCSIGGRYSVQKKKIKVSPCDQAACKVSSRRWCTKLQLAAQKRPLFCSSQRTLRIIYWASSWQQQPGAGGEFQSYLN